MKSFISWVVLLCFLCTGTVGPLPSARADGLRLPPPGVMVHLSPSFSPPVLKGIKVHTNNPFRFDFILDKGDSRIGNAQLKNESARLIKYFLASLTIPEKDLWVNLSPYEKDRIVPRSFGLTEMGRDLLAEDYMLKQITASLIYPEGRIGKEFWKKVYQEAQAKYGTTDVPVNTFNKVWIVPDKAVVYENAQAGSAYVVKARLKVMLEQDYLSMKKHKVNGHMTPMNRFASGIIRQIVIPQLTREVNEGRNFARLRQVYNSLILADWYKKKIRDSILEQVYADKNKVKGVGYASGTPGESGGDVEAIYQRYLQAFKKGAYDYIKEEVDPRTQQPFPRKYFSGGVNFFGDMAMTVTGVMPEEHDPLYVVTADMRSENYPSFKDAAMVNEGQTADEVKGLIEQAAQNQTRAMRNLGMLEPQDQEDLISWLGSEKILPEKPLLKKLWNNIVIQQTNGSPSIAAGWLKVLARKWNVPQRELNALMTWMVHNKIAQNKIALKNVSDDALYAFFMVWVRNSQMLDKPVFVYNCAPYLDANEKINDARANIERLMKMSSPDFVKQNVVFKADIPGTKYFIGMQYSLAESTNGYYLTLGVEQHSPVNPLKGVFFRIGLDTQGDALRIIMMQGVQRQQKAINAFSNEFGNLHPGVALMYVALELAAQGHLRYNEYGFERPDRPFKRILGVYPEYIPTMKNGTPTINIMSNYTRFGLRQKTGFVPVAGPVSEKTFEEKFNELKTPRIEHLFEWLMKEGYFREKEGTQGHPKPLTEAMRLEVQKTYPNHSGVILSILESPFYRWQTVDYLRKVFIPEYLRELANRMDEKSQKKLAVINEMMGLLHNLKPIEVNPAIVEADDPQEEQDRQGPADSAQLVKEATEQAGVQSPQWGPATSPEVIIGYKRALFGAIARFDPIKPYAKTVRLIQELAGAGYALGVGSSSKDAKKNLEDFGIISKFRTVVDATTPGVPKKSSGYFFKAVAQRMDDMDPQDAVVFEDAPAGVQDARQGGFGLIVAIARNRNVVPELRANGADIILEDVHNVDEAEGLDLQHLKAWFNQKHPGRRLEGVIFDMDGIISNTQDQHYDSWKEALDSYLRYRHVYGRDFTMDDNYRFFAGQSGPHVVVNFLKSRGIELQANQAMAHAPVSENGGIDLTAQNTPLEIQNSGAWIKFHIDPAMFRQLQDSPGFVPVIISIRQTADLHGFLSRA
ncbi:MAG: HAD hydrolase-like protein [Candidatus Omnitrophica bacterium]|nr:HAD hydrolase-like protein [Candidatus Omnitrophota bacterium]